MKPKTAEIPDLHEERAATAAALSFSQGAFVGVLAGGDPNGPAFPGLRWRMRMGKNYRTTVNISDKSEIGFDDLNTIELSSRIIKSAVDSRDEHDESYINIDKLSDIVFAVKIAVSYITTKAGIISLSESLSSYDPCDFTRSWIGSEIINDQITVEFR